MRNRAKMGGKSGATDRGWQKPHRAGNGKIAVLPTANVQQLGAAAMAWLRFVSWGAVGLLIGHRRSRTTVGSNSSAPALTLQTSHDSQE
ncbi:MAG TPA: hypothetical protein VES67_03950 [Vicinamibacterales bacterium]|nr:hypothetical protein [Vicinamibacterales bacterium]